jgi:nucleotide-binding universal stress UspA family protein
MPWGAPRFGQSQKRQRGSLQPRYDRSDRLAEVIGNVTALFTAFSLKRRTPMQPFGTILFAADFSENSKEAFLAACSVAVENQSRIVVLHVAEPEFVPEEPVYYGQQAVQFFPREPIRARHEALEQKMREVYVADRRLELEYQLREGDAAVEILREARQVGSELIVVGTHGRTGLRRLLAGSVATAVLHGAPCPVLALRSAEQPRPARGIHVILHATDFSVDSDAALRLARQLAREHGARLFILHVERLDVLSYGTPAADVDPRVFMDALDNMRKRVDGPDLKSRVETMLRRGFAPEGIIGAAEEIGCDLIVIGTHGRTGLSRLLMGSVAEHVLPKASCAVLIVKAGQRGSVRAPNHPAEELMKAL